MNICRRLQMATKFRRMSDSDVRLIVADLDRWAAGQLGSKLTWAVLEERFGFSRQSLQAKPEIKAAYDFAKKSLAGGLVVSRDQAGKDIGFLQREVQRLELEVAEHKRRETLWKERWQRIAFNIRQKGVQIHQIDCDLPSKGSNICTYKDASSILKEFDEEI